MPNSSILFFAVSTIIAIYCIMGFALDADKEVSLLHKEFVGESRISILLDRFNRADFSSIGGGFARTWQQVMTSRSTGLLGTGIALSSVSATYGDIADGTVSVVNSGFDSNLNPIRIDGKSRTRDGNPLCRTVAFDTVPVEGDYWITYISEDLSTVIVTAPIIVETTIFSFTVTPNFGLYVLTKNREDFWNDRDLVKEVMDVSRQYGFVGYHNKPIVSGKSFTFGSEELDIATPTDQRFRG